MAEGPIQYSGKRYNDLTLSLALKKVSDEAAKPLMKALERRLANVRQEMETFQAWCDRADRLYCTPDITAGGADLWADHASATTAGRSHVSINLPAAYVDIPAALQAVEPIENMVATDNSKEAREAAAAMERVYIAWKAEEDYDLKFHKATTIKGLYGRTASRVVMGEKVGDEDPHPEIEVIEQPRNLYMGYKTDSYDELEWTAYLMRYEPNALCEEFGVQVNEEEIEGKIVPFLSELTQMGMPTKPWLNWGDARIEVWDYWYRVMVWGKNRKLLRVETWNVVIAGNLILQGPTKYAEYKGALPYVPLFNTFVPGTPNGRPELYDIEQIIREKFEKITAGSQMIANGVAGDYWQLTGPDAPTRVPAGLKPKRNELVAPGPGNRIETITPFIMQFQLEQYLGRLDREAAVVSGLNDLLIGLAPAQVLSSSKAINALIANYETRLSMRRKLLYAWRKATWELVVQVWATQKTDAGRAIAAIVKDGGGVLDLVDPSLSPRDEAETATRAGNLVNMKLWSQRRGMDAVGVDDPETEQDMIREERTDATLFPEDVQLMAQLLAALQSLGLNAPQSAEAQAGAQMSSGQADLRTALGARTATNTTGAQQAGDMGMAPSIPGAPPEAGGPSGPGLPFAAAGQPANANPGLVPGQAPVAQSMMQGGKLKNRILSQTTLGRR